MVGGASYVVPISSTRMPRDEQNPTGSAPMADTSGCVVTAQKPPPSRSTQHTGAVRRSSVYSSKGAPLQYSVGPVGRPASAFRDAMVRRSDRSSDDQAVGAGVALRLEQGVVRLQRPGSVG